MEALANGQKFRTFRGNFIAGKLMQECQECTIKPTISIQDFKQRLIRHLEQKVNQVDDRVIDSQEAASAQK